jgi:hypothetical protein
MIVIGEILGEASENLSDELTHSHGFYTSNEDLF